MYSLENLQRARATMPKTPMGHIVNPAYLPANLQKQMLTEWGKYLRATPRSSWEPWMHRLVIQQKEAAKRSSKPSCSTSEPSMRSTVDEK